MLARPLVVEGQENMIMLTDGSNVCLVSTPCMYFFMDVSFANIGNISKYSEWCEVDNTITR